MIDLEDLLEKVREFCDYNYAWADDHIPLLAAGTELAELTRAHIENECGILPDSAAQDKKIDAVGDLVICLLDYCGRQNINPEDAIISAWDQIKDRDYVRYPTTKGRAPEGEAEA